MIVKELECIKFSSLVGKQEKGRQGHTNTRQANAARKQKRKQNRTKKKTFRFKMPSHQSIRPPKPLFSKGCSS